MDSRDIVRIARQRADLTQQQLADRSGHPRETIARWESGAREPSLATLRALVDASGLELVVSLAERDPSLDGLIRDQLALPPSERLRRLLPAEALDPARSALDWVAAARTPMIVVGSIAAVLQGGPQRPRDGHVEIVSSDPYSTATEMRAASLTPLDTEDRWAPEDARETWSLPGGGTLVLAIDPPGTHGFRDLRRSAREVALEGGAQVTVAHPRDLLRAAGASKRETERAQVPALRALLRHHSEARATP